MPDPNKDDPKKQGETAKGNQSDPTKTMDKDRNEGQKEYTEGGGFGKQEHQHDVGQSVEGGMEKDIPRKEAVPNQQNPEKKQDKEPVKASEKTGVK